MGMNDRGVIKMRLQKKRLQDVKFPRVMTKENTLLLMNDCHYYFDSYELPFDCIATGMTFCELEAFYTLPAMDGWFKVQNKNGTKHIEMFTFGNNEKYEHPLIRVDAQPVVCQQLTKLAVVRYNMWFLSAGTSPFKMVASDHNYMPVNITSHLYTTSTNAKIRELPFSVEMHALMKSMNIEPWTSDKSVYGKGWDFSRFAWDETQHYELMGTIDEQFSQSAAFAAKMYVYTALFANYVQISTIWAVFASTWIACCHFFLSWMTKPKSAWRKSRRSRKETIKIVAFIAFVSIQMAIVFFSQVDTSVIPESAPLTTDWSQLIYTGNHTPFKPCSAGFAEGAMF